MSGVECLALLEAADGPTARLIADWLDRGGYSDPLVPELRRPIEASDIENKLQQMREYLQKFVSLAKNKRMELARIDDDVAFLSAWVQGIRMQKSEPITDQWQELLQRPLPVQDFAFVILAAAPWLQHDREGKPVGGMPDLEGSVARQNPTRNHFVGRALHFAEAARGIGSKGMELSNFRKN